MKKSYTEMPPAHNLLYHTKESDSDSTHEVEAIIDHNIDYETEKMQFKVKWAKE